MESEMLFSEWFKRTYGYEIKPGTDEFERQWRLWKEYLVKEALVA